MFQHEPPGANKQNGIIFYIEQYVVKGVDGYEKVGKSLQCRKNPDPISWSVCFDLGRVKRNIWWPIGQVKLASVVL